MDELLCLIIGYCFNGNLGSKVKEDNTPVQYIPKRKWGKFSMEKEKRTRESGSKNTDTSVNSSPLSESEDDPFNVVRRNLPSLFLF